mmetsp:Transcript_13579/g.31916  ORF Transcript_13579/g.31916 Transcript_13579/m.31916 type:complete len:256 (+) Transcript_13579:176-943(+)
MTLLVSKRNPRVVSFGLERLHVILCGLRNVLLLTNRSLLRPLLRLSGAERYQACQGCVTVTGLETRGCVRHRGKHCPSAHVLVDVRLHRRLPLLWPVRSLLSLKLHHLDHVSNLHVPPGVLSNHSDAPFVSKAPLGIRNTWLRNVSAGFAGTRPTRRGRTLLSEMSTVGIRPMRRMARGMRTLPIFGVKIRGHSHRWSSRSGLSRLHAPEHSNKLRFFGPGWLLRILGPGWLLMLRCSGGVMFCESSCTRIRCYS